MRPWNGTGYLINAIIVGIGVTAAALLVTLVYCPAGFGSESCPGPDVEVWAAAIIGALTTALFFLLVDRRAKKILDRLVDKEKKKDHTMVNLLVFAAIISGFAYALPVFYCGQLSGNDLCPTPDGKIVLGAGIGAVATALFFFLISKRFESALEELGKLYVARTCILNLIDIFGKAADDPKARIIKSDKNRLYFLKILSEDYIEEFKIRDSTVKDIYERASAHRIEPYHSHLTCSECKEIVALIAKFEVKKVNTILDGADVKSGWIGT